MRTNALVAEMPSLEKRASQFMDQGLTALEVEAALKQQWKKDVRETVGRDIPIPQMWNEAHRLIQAANDILELKLHGKSLVADLEGERDQPYYSIPILPGWMPQSEAPHVDGLLQPFKHILIEELGLHQQAPLILPESAEDLQRIGDTKRDLFSSVFWTEIRLLHQRQRPRPTDERARDLLLSASGREKERAQALFNTLGHEIHGIRAKDSTDRWAYYFVHVSQSKERKFLDVIEGDGDIDLADYGYIVAREYEQTYRTRQTARYEAFFKERLNAYATFAETHRIYSMPSQDFVDGRKSFAHRRLAKAVVDSGSRGALAEELSRTAIERGTALDSDTPTFRLPVLFERGIIATAADTVLTVLRERRIGAEILPDLGRLLTTPTKEQLATILGNVRQVARLFGRDEDAFERFEVLYFQNRGLQDEHALENALRLAVSAPLGFAAFLPVVGFAGFLSQVVAKYKQRATKAVHAQEFGRLRPAIASLDVVLQLAGPYEAAFRAAVRSYCGDASRRTDAFLEASQILEKIVSAAHREMQEVPAAEAPSRGVRVERNISTRLASFALPKNQDDKDHLFLLEDSFSLSLRAISIVGIAIEEKPYSEKRQILEDLIRGPLSQACDVASYPMEKRQDLLGRLLDALLVHDLEKPQEQRWTQRVQEDQGMSSLELNLPTVAPALWKTDKLPGDTPPDFIKRHYGPFLRQDGLGLTKADIRRLDFSLYMGLANWLRPKGEGSGNVLPDDCPLPTLSERNDRAIEELQGSVPTEELERLGQVRRRRQLALRSTNSVK